MSASNKKVSDYMSSPARTIGSDQTLKVAKNEFYQNGIRHLPVLEGGRCIGILSDRDLKLAYAVENSAADNLKIKDACNVEVYQVNLNDRLADVARHMAENHIGSAVVVENHKVKGIFTVTDACRALAELCS